MEEGIGSRRLAVKSPCLSICEMGTDGLCRGCFRTLDEIAAWGVMDDLRRLQVLQSLEARRNGAGGPA